MVLFIRRGLTACVFRFGDIEYGKYAGSISPCRLILHIPASGTAVLFTNILVKAIAFHEPVRIEAKRLRVDLFVGQDGLKQTTQHSNYIEDRQTHYEFTMTSESLGTK